MFTKIDVFHLLIIGGDVELSGPPFLQLPPTTPALEVISMKRLTILMIMLFIVMTMTGCRCCRRLRGARCRGFAPPAYAPASVQYGYPACPPCSLSPACTTYSDPCCCCETQCPPAGGSPSYTDESTYREPASGSQWQTVPEPSSQTRYQQNQIPGELFSRVVDDRILRTGEELPDATATPEPPKPD